MKKLKMIVASVIVLAIVGSAFSFNAKKLGRFCVSANINSTSCNIIFTGFKRVPGTADHYYISDWDGVACSFSAPQTCTTSAKFVED